MLSLNLFAVLQSAKIRKPRGTKAAFTLIRQSTFTKTRLTTSHSSIQMATPFYRFVKCYGPPDSESVCSHLSPASPMRQYQHSRGHLRPLVASKGAIRRAAVPTTINGNVDRKVLLIDTSVPKQRQEATTTSCKRRWWQRSRCEYTGAGEQL